MGRIFDWPPVYLLVCIGLAWLETHLWSVVEPIPILRHFGYFLVSIGICLAALAVVEMRKHRTTPIPHRTAQALVQTGVFAFSRNPIYLADLLILAGLCLAWSAWASLVLIGVLWWTLTKRFVEPEEARLRHTFRDAFEAYAAATRRWL